MKITVLTLFPEMFEGFLQTSIIHRAIENHLVDVECIQIRDYALDKFKHVDDKPFGGGAGMIMKSQPIFDALKDIEKGKKILLSAKGKPYKQAMAHDLAKEEHIILLCGHYEGVDERIAEEMDEEISIGDYVLTGGEVASLVVMDSIIRLLDGSINKESIVEESYENGLLEYPQYTQPANYEGKEVPKVLLSGNHAKIREWRMAKSLLYTKEFRKDLYDAHILTNEEEEILSKIEKDEKYLMKLEDGEF